jgi:predicted GTPase
MNDKIKDLIDKAYKTDSIAKNKWRIENREQLREQRKKELKELMEKDKTMTNNKQSSSVEWLFEELFNSFEKFNNGEFSFAEYMAHNLKLRKQAKAMHRREHADTARDWWVEGASDARKTHTEKYESFDDYYTEKFTAEQPA